MISKTTGFDAKFYRPYADQQKHWPTPVLHPRLLKRKGCHSLLRQLSNASTQFLEPIMVEKFLPASVAKIQMQFELPKMLISQKRHTAMHDYCQSLSRQFPPMHHYPVDNECSLYVENPDLANAFELMATGLGTSHQLGLSRHSLGTTTVTVPEEMQLL